MNLINSGFLRGIGVGLIVAGLLIHFGGTSSEQSKLSAQQQVVSQKNTQQTQSQPKAEQPEPGPQPKPQPQTELPTVPQTQTQPKSSSPDVITLKVPNGSGSERIAALLQDQGLITDEQDFAALSEKLKADTRFKAGKFSIPRGATDREIIAILTGK